MADTDPFKAQTERDLIRLHEAIGSLVDEADRLRLRMVAIHLCNAMHSLSQGATTVTFERDESDNAGMQG